MLQFSFSSKQKSRNRLHPKHASLDFKRERQAKAAERRVLIRLWQMDDLGEVWYYKSEERDCGYEAFPIRHTDRHTHARSYSCNCFNQTLLWRTPSIPTVNTRVHKHPRPVSPDWQNQYEGRAWNSYLRNRENSSLTCIPRGDFPACCVIGVNVGKMTAGGFKQLTSNLHIVGLNPCLDVWVSLITVSSTNGMMCRWRPQIIALSFLPTTLFSSFLVCKCAWHYW